MVTAAAIANRIIWAISMGITKNVEYTIVTHSIASANSFVLSGIPLPSL